MIRRILAIVLLVVLVAPAGAAVADEPHFEVTVSDPQVRAGTTEGVTMILQNDAKDPDDVVPTAKSVEVSVGGDGPIDVLSGSRSLGNLTDGQSRGFNIVLDVPSNTPGGTYRLPVQVSYTVDGDRKTTTVSAEIRVAQQQQDFKDPRFELSVPEPKLRAEGAQQLTIELRNDAKDPDDIAETATSVEVNISGNGPIDVDSGPRTLSKVPDGVPQPITVTIDVPTNAPGGTYRLPVRIKYVEADGDQESTTLRATVHVERRARFEIGTPQTAARIGGDGSVLVDVTNVGERRANAARLTLVADTPVLSFGGEPSASRFLDDIPPGETRTAEFDLSVGESATLTAYSLDATVDYRTTDGAPTRARTLTIGVTPQVEQTFRIAHLNDSLRVGEEGTVSLNVTNEGPDPVSNAVVTLNTSSDITALEPAVAIGRLEPGEVRDVTFDVRVEDAARNGNRQFEARVQYRDADDERRTSDTTDIKVAIDPERSFTAAITESRLRAGQEGSVTVTIANNGPGAAQDAVVTLASGNTDLTLRESEIAVGRVPVSEARTVTFDIDVNDEANSGRRQFDVQVRYRTDDGNERASDKIAVQAGVAKKRPDFRVETNEATVSPGGTTIVNVSVTNLRGEPVEDVSAKLFASTPLSTSIGEGFVDRLGPNKSVTLRFEITSQNSAIVGNVYPVQLDFQFDTPDGETLISDTYQAPIRITAPNSGRGGGFSLGLIAGGVIVALVIAGGVTLYRRRRK